MSYSACDFLENCEANADAYGVPPITREHWNTLGVDDEPVSEEDWQDYCDGERGQLVLAERIGCALNTRRRLLAALQAAVETEEGNYSRPHDQTDPDAEDSEPAWMFHAREAIKEATA